LEWIDTCHIVSQTSLFLWPACSKAASVPLAQSTVAVSPVPKPVMFKIGGAWVWRCDDGAGPVGDEFGEDYWRHPWDACLAAASKHAVLYHDDSEVVEEVELP
jgi:hypothetical protein